MMSQMTRPSLLGIISDTHDNVANIIKAVSIFRKKKVNMVIHLGDIVAPGTVKFFKGAKMLFVLGNCDGDIIHIKEEAEKIKGKFVGNVADFEFAGKLFLAVHNPDCLMATAINSQRFDYILHGHTHKKKDEKHGRTRVINPGAHYYLCENTIAILNAENDRLEFIKVS